MPPTRLARLTALLVGGLIAAGVLELLLRQVYWLPQRFDPVFGLQVEPGSTVHWWREGSGRSRWTTHGLRRASPPDPKSRPILALGDSFTEAFMIDDPDVFTHRLEEILGERGRPTPIFNAGHSDFSAADYVGHAPRYRALFHPRWTIVQLREDDLTSDSWRKEKAHFVETTTAAGARRLEARLVPPQIPRWAAELLPFRRRSALLNYALVRLQNFRQIGAPASVPKDFVYPIRETIDALVSAYDGRVTLLLLPIFDPARPGHVETEIEQRFDAHCRESGLSCVNLRSAYPELAARHLSPFGFPNSTYNVGHMNAVGHRRAALLLADEMDRLNRESDAAPEGLRRQSCRPPW